MIWKYQSHYQWHLVCRKGTVLDLILILMYINELAKYIENKTDC